MTLNSQSPILVVDDDHAIRSAMVEFLNSEGFRAVSAKDGQDALDQLAGGLRPAVIFLDITMPQMNGHSFWEKYQVLKIESPVYAFTASSTRENPLPGSAGFLKKPVDVLVLLEVAERHCERLQ